MTKYYETRPSRYTDKWGYNTDVTVESGEDGQPPKMVHLTLGEYRGMVFSDEAWTILTPDQARQLAGELNDAANQAERGGE
jgi:hypothetical protein